MFLFATSTVGEKEAALVAEEILIRIDAVISVRLWIGSLLFYLKISITILGKFC